MKPLAIVVGLVLAFIAGCFVEHAFEWPIGWVDTMLTTAPVTSTLASAPPTTVIPRYSSARGAEDAPRNDTPQGSATDLQRCINTMVLRRESETEARTVCRKIIAGIGG